MAGVDEAGRGPLAGPVVAAAVILDPRWPIGGLADSKSMSPKRREAVAVDIQNCAADWALGQASAAEIDELNILNATLLAMERAVVGLRLRPSHALVDGRHCPSVACTVEALVGGDASVPCISAASILAKVHRDAQMRDLAARYPGYGFERHKGYPTRDHLAALARHGASPHHRRSFRPVREHLARAGGGE